MNNFVLTNAVLMMMLLVSCASQRLANPIPRFHDDGPKLNPVKSTTVWVDPRLEDVPTGVTIQRDRWYLFSATTILDASGRRYSDASETLSPATPDGSFGLLPALFNLVLRDVSSERRPHDRLRVRRDASGASAGFLVLMGCMGPSSSHADLGKAAFIIGSRRIWQAPCTGKLHVFVNDWPDNSSTSRPPRSMPYSNNRGGVVLTIIPLPESGVPLRLSH